MMQPLIMPNSDWLKDRTTCWLLMMGASARGDVGAGARRFLDSGRALAHRERRRDVDHAGEEQAARYEPLMVGAGAGVLVLLGACTRSR